MRCGLRRVDVEVLADGVHQVRLAEADAAVDEQRVVGPRGGLGDGAGGRVGELVRRSDDELLEGVALLVLRRRSGGGFGRVRRGRGVPLRGGRRRGIVGDQRDGRPRPAQLVGGLPDDPGVVAGQPLLEAVVGNQHGDGVVVVLDEPRGLEPGVEDVPADLVLDTRQDLVPEVARHWRHSRRVRRATRSAGMTVLPSVGTLRLSASVRTPVAAWRGAGSSKDGHHTTAGRMSESSITEERFGIREAALRGPRSVRGKALPRWVGRCHGLAAPSDRRLRRITVEFFK